jgi:hypothetical protein
MAKNKEEHIRISEWFGRRSIIPYVHFSCITPGRESYKASKSLCWCVWESVTPPLGVVCLSPFIGQGLGYNVKPTLM